MLKTSLDFALHYHAFGWSIIPMAVNKKDKRKYPIIPNWKKYQSIAPDTDQLVRWFGGKFKSAGMGVVTGKVSNIVVIDVDAGGDVSIYPPTAMVKTGSGYHLYCRYPGYHVKTITQIRPNTDIRGDGGIAVLPPTVHYSGKKYEWIVPFDSHTTADLPEFVSEWLKESSSKKLSIKPDRHFGESNDQKLNALSVPIATLFERDGHQLQQVGKNLVTHCPFHFEKTASCVISEDKNKFYCFGCGKYGDPLNYIQLTLNLSFTEALKYLSNNNILSS